MQRTTDSEGRNVRYSIAHPMFGDLGTQAANDKTDYQHKLDNRLKYNADTSNAMQYLQNFPIGDQTIDFTQLLTSLIEARLAMMEGIEKNQDVGKLGYVFDGSRWGLAPHDAVKGGEPWFKTSREALNAIYEEGLRDSKGDLPASLSGMTIGDLYNEASNYMQQQLADEKNAVANEYARRRYRDPTTGAWLPMYSERGLGHTVASLLLPMRTYNAYTDNELRDVLTEDEWASLAALDAGEAALTFTPYKMMSLSAKLGTKGIEALSKVMPKAAKALETAGSRAMQNRFLQGAKSQLQRHAMAHPVLAQMESGMLLNPSIDLATAAGEQVLDDDNLSQSGEWTPQRAILSMIAGGIAPLGRSATSDFLDFVGKDRIKDPRLLNTGKEGGIRQLLSDQVARNDPSVSIHDPKSWTSKDIKEVRKAPSWSSWYNQPFVDLEKGPMKGGNYLLDLITPPNYRKATILDPKTTPMRDPVSGNKTVVRSGTDQYGRNVEASFLQQKGGGREIPLAATTTGDFGKVTPDFIDDWLKNMSPEQRAFFSKFGNSDDIVKFATEKPNLFRKFVDWDKSGKPTELTPDEYAQLRGVLSDNNAASKFVHDFIYPSGFKSKKKAKAALDDARKQSQLRRNASIGKPEETPWYNPVTGTMRPMLPSFGRRLGHATNDALQALIMTAGRHAEGMPGSDVLPGVEEKGPYRYKVDFEE